MPVKEQTKRRRGAVAITELVGKVLEPMAAKRSFARAELAAAWPEIVGPDYADCSAPEKIAWPRGAAGGEEAAQGLLTVRVDGPRALYLQHELPQILERVNGFLGYAAIKAVRLVQGPVTPRKRRPPPPLPLDAAGEAELAQRLSGVADDGLKAALDRLGRGILADRKRG